MEENAVEASEDEKKEGSQEDEAYGVGVPLVEGKIAERHVDYTISTHGTSGGFANLLPQVTLTLRWQAY